MWSDQVMNYPMEHYLGLGTLDLPYRVRCHLRNHCSIYHTKVISHGHTWNPSQQQKNQIFFWNFTYRSWPMLSSFSNFLATLCEPRNFSFSSSVKSKYLSNKKSIAFQWTVDIREETFGFVKFTVKVEFRDCSTQYFCLIGLIFASSRPLRCRVFVVFCVIAPRSV